MLKTTCSQSVAALFAKWVTERHSAPALHEVHDQSTRTYTWGELDELVHRWTAALHDLGVRRDDRVVLWSENRVEWIVCDLAIQNLLALHVPLHNTLSGRQAIDQIRHCGATFVLLAGCDQLKKLKSCRMELPRDTTWLSFDAVRSRQIVDVRHISALAAASDPEVGRQLADESTYLRDEDAPTTILYSSGTTGKPKGVVLSQRNLVSNALDVVEAFGEQPIDTRLCFLPLSHVFSRTCDLYTWLARGSHLALARSHHTIIDDCKRFAPTLINGVPYFFERVRQKLIEAGVADEPDKLREVLGGKIRGCCSGGAALPIETFDFFESRGVPLLQGYGLTESSPVISLSTLDIRKRGTAGRPLNSVEVSITDDGEILTRGPHVMLGYWQDDAATHEVIRDGWLHTGDLGAIDDEGYLCITGRKKEIIVTRTGKNIFPTHIESLLCRDPFILQALVIGNNRKYLTALIVPDPDVLKAEIKSRRLFVFRRKTAVSHPKILALYRQRIDRQLADQSRHEQICRFRVLDHGFTPNNGYLTPKLSLRRELILRDFADEIESLYE